MSVTAADIYARGARIFGARTGTIASGGATTAVLTGLVGTTGDDTSFAGWRIIFPDAGVAADSERLITAWADATGTATFATRSDATPTGERYILVSREDYTINEFRLALDKCLNQTPRTYRRVIPFTPYLREYPLDQLDFMTGDGDVDAVYCTYSPLMLHNEDMSLWQLGASLAPDGFTLEGTGASVARVTGGVRSNYAARLTAGGGAPLRLVQKIPESLSQWITRRTFPIFNPMRAAAWAKTQNANSVRVFIRYVESSSGSPVTTYEYSSYMTADGRPQFPTLSLTPSGTQDQYEWGIEVLASHTADLSWAGLMQNTIDFTQAYQIKDAGSQFYRESEILRAIRNVGGVPYVELAEYPATWGQLVLYVRRPFPAYTADTDSFDDQYARVLTAGFVRWLLDAVKPNQDRTRLDRIMAEQGKIWTRLITNQVDIPVPNPPARLDVFGA